MPAQLLALTGGNNILLDKPILLLGRHPECDIQLESRKISRRHCCIAQIQDFLVVRDLGSTNGIRINGVRVLEGRLRGGDELTIGNFRYQISWDAYAAAVPRPAPQASASDAQSSTPQPPEDDDLESCDEPVPLPEDEAPNEPVAAPVGAYPRRSPVDDRSSEEAFSPPPPGKPAKKEDSAISFVLPDNLELAPSSDEYPKAARSNGTP